MHQLRRCFRGLKMNQQVIIFGFIIITIVLLIILGTCFVQASILFTAIQSSSQVITTKQEKRSIESTSNRIQDYLKRKYYEEAVHNVLHIEKFFQRVLQIKEMEQRINISDQLFSACEKPNENHKKQKNIKNDTDHFCYQSLYNSDGITLPNNKEIDFFNMTVSMLSEYSLLFDASKENQLFIYDEPTPHMMISYPQSYQVQNYSIYNRSWFKYYQSYKSENKSYYYSPVFLSAITNDLVLAVISTIKNKQGDYIGLTAQSFVLNDKNIQAIPINIILANDDGYIILTSIDSIKSAKEKIFIYNTTYTGFNESDWQQIKDHSNNEPLQSFCSGFPDTFCLYNKYFESNVQVDALRFTPENFTLVVFINVTFTTQLDQQYQQLTHQLSSQIIQIEWILIIACFIMLTIAAIIIQILFRPLFQVMTNIKYHIKTIGNNIDKEIFTMQRKLIHKTDIFSKLSIKFMSLQEIFGKNHSSKCDMCVKIESFEYNKKDIPYDLTRINSIVENLSDSSMLNINSTPKNQKVVNEQKCNNFYDVFHQSLNELYKITY